MAPQERRTAPRFARRPPDLPRVPEGDLVPEGMRVAGAWGWRILVLCAVAAVVMFVIAQLRIVVVPLLIAVLLAALLVPFVGFLVRHGWPRGLAIAVTELGVIAAVAALLFLVVTQVMSGFSDIQHQTIAAIQELRQALKDSPLHVTDDQLNGILDQITNSVRQDSSAVISSALSLGSTLGHFLTGVLLTLFSTLFILIDGKGIWRWIVRVFPRRARDAVNGAGQAGWRTLRSFVKVQILVAFVDAVGIGVGAAILQVPLALPIAVLVFLGSFIPIIGAVVTGILAVFIALVYNGWVVALIMLGIVLLVQQIEGHILQPLVMGSAVKVHPLAVVLAVATGSIIAGIPGALFAVPFAATLNVMVRYVAGKASAPDLKDSPHA